MTVFADLLPLDARDLWWGLEVSLDNFATIAYRWATHSGDVEGAFFQARLLDVGNIQRGFGTDYLPVASTVDLTLDNTDFAADFLCDHATVETTTFRARFRLKVGLSTTAANDYQSTILTQKLGNFVCLDFPRRQDGKVFLSLADDSLGQLADLIVPPTLNDWLDAFEASAGGANMGPFGNVTWPNSPKPIGDSMEPSSIQFGNTTGAEPYSGKPAFTFGVTRTPGDFDAAFFGSGRRPFIYPILVLATRDSAAITAGDVVTLTGTFRQDVIRAPQLRGGTITIPSTFNYQYVGSTPLWKAYKTDTISLVAEDGNSYDWKLLWIAMDMGAYALFIDGFRYVNQGANPPSNTTIPIAPEFPTQFQGAIQGSLPSPDPQACNGMFAAFAYFGIVGAPGSQITGISEDARIGDPIDILQDLVESYSVMGAGAADTARFARARQSAHVLIRGSIAPDGSGRQTSGQQLTRATTAYGIGTLRKTIAEIAGTADVDVFVTMEGKVGVITQGGSYDVLEALYVGSHPTIDESRIDGVQDGTPSQGERWSPYNRVFVLAGDGQQLGPFDSPDAIASWGRIIAKVIPGKWWQSLQEDPDWVLSSVSFAWGKRNLEAKVRPIIKFTTDVAVLAIELGDYFLMSWTRGGNNSAYASALWRLEAVNIQPAKGSVDVTAVWMGDIQTVQPFLLDNESLVIRTAPAGGHGLVVTTGSTTVSSPFSDFVADGVAPGDILLLRDTGETYSSFDRNRQIKVVSVTDATHLVVADSVFGSAGAHSLTSAMWSIVRSYLTYPTVGSDPANYPAGAAMYGKVSDSTFKFSDATNANQLLDG